MATKRQAKKVAKATEAKKTVETVEKKTAVPVEPAKKEEVKKEAVKKEEVKKETVKKETEKKAPVKKATVKKEMKTRVVVEYYGKQVEDKEMIAAVKKVWTKSGKKVGDIKTMALYVKPEENSVYYVINDKVTGRIEF